MNDQMNELVQFSPYAGVLFLEKVPGEASKIIEHENDVSANDGMDRTMYAYAPRSGCPDPKQCQVLMVLRDSDTEKSAAQLLTTLGLERLAEEEHFLVLFPNPTAQGWNYRERPDRDNDMDFLVRCFGVLRSSVLGINGFNGMVFYLAASEGASALMMTLAARDPMNVPGMMIGAFPEGYHIPGDALNVEVAACVLGNEEAAAYIKKANGVSAEEASDAATVFYGSNPACRLMVTNLDLPSAVRPAWDRLFSLSRRWQNDTYGTYQKRTAFTKRGFTAHVKDTSLGCNQNFAHTWYEYVPPQLRGTAEKVPLVFYFHGVNCVPLYGAEQSNWHEVADRENFIVVYPAPASYKAWNIFNDPCLPCDFEFVLALIEHMKSVHSIDETRIYATGFSMGGMMTHAITAAYPEVFAAGAPCNAFDFAYFENPSKIYSTVVKGADAEAMSPNSVQRQMADEKRARMHYRMPIFQIAGYNDTIVCHWPTTSGTDDVRTKTLSHWMEINNISANGLTADADAFSGIAADESFYEDEGQRFFHQRWQSRDEGAPVLMELLLAKRMPHAIAHIQIEYAWNFIKKFSRQQNGSLNINK